MKKYLLAAALLALAAPAHAESFTLDPVHSQVMFAADHLGFSHSHGRFADVTGTFNFDEKTPEKASANLVIKTASLAMDDAAWDEHLKSADFFNVAKFPDMTFKTTSVFKGEGNTAKVTGDLTLLGVTKPVTLDVTYNKGAIHPMTKKYTAGFSATGTLKRSDFGMAYGLPGIGDDVKLMIEIEGTRAAKAGDKADAAPKAEAAPAEDKAEATDAGEKTDE